jgi:hypothetical protein
MRNKKKDKMYEIKVEIPKEQLKILLDALDCWMAGMSTKQKSKKEAYITKAKIMLFSVLKNLEIKGL